MRCENHTAVHGLLRHILLEILFFSELTFNDFEREGGNLPQEAWRVKVLKVCFYDICIFLLIF